MSSPRKKVTTYQAILGGILRIKRKEQGFSSEKFTKKMGVGASTWSKVENGLSALTAEQIARAAKELQTTPGALMQEADKMVEALKEDDIEITSQKNKKSSFGVFLVGAALGAFLATILSDSDKT